VFRTTRARDALPSFGEKLKLEREKRNISLDQISATTKIGTRMLQALEEEKFNQLPGGIFNKGFVRAYARAVGLDEDQAVADYLQASGDVPRPELVTRDAARESSPAREEENRIRLIEATSDEPSKPIPWGIFAAILLVIALALSLWSHRRQQEEKTAHSTPKTTVEQNATPAQPSQEPSPPPSETSTPATSQQNPTSPNTTGATGASPAATSPEKPVPTSSQTSPLSAPSPGEFVVLVHAREQSWLSVSVDGKPVGSELLEPGSDRTFRAHNRVFVKAGNAGALDFHLDGRKLDVGGDYGEVKSVTIGHAGVIPTPDPAPQNP
jgi:cytoskeleton protein RodZ